MEDEQQLEKQTNRMQLNLSFQQIIISFIVASLFGKACAHFAQKKNRDPQRWFIYGMLFGIFALGVILLLPPPEVLQPVEVAEGAARVSGEPEPPPVDPFKTTLEERQWYYLDAKHQQQGPIDFEILKAERSQGTIQNSTYLWSEGMQDWMPLKELSYLLTEIE